MDRPESDEPNRDLPNAPPSEETALPREVYALLAQANLLRMRGHWEEAAAGCMAALRLAPDSSSANSLLGDIYENQSRFDDAIQWYRMALDANPNSPADRLKLDRLLQRDPPLPHDLPLPVPLAAARPQSAQQGGVPNEAPGSLWLKRLRRDPEIALRWAVVTVVLAVLLVIMGAFAVAHSGKRSVFGGSGDQEVQSAPVVVPPLTGTLPSDPDAVPMHDAGEQVVLTSLQASRDLSAKGITVYDVLADPRDGHLTVTFGLVSTGVTPRTLILRDALQVLQAAATSESASSTLTVRCLLVTSSGTPAAATLAFAGDAAPGIVQAENPTNAGLSDSQVEALFSNAWWSATANIGT